MTYGYIRVSSTDQNVNRQIDAMRQHGVEESFLFIDRQSGKDFLRPEWHALLEKMQEGDLLCITSLDRMGRNYAEIQEQWRILTKERQKEGIAAARSRGVHFGRTAKDIPENFHEVVKLKRDGKITWKQASEYLKIPESTVRHYAKKGS